MNCSNCGEPWGMDTFELDGKVYCPVCYIQTTKVLKKMGVKTSENLSDIAKASIWRSNDESKS